MYYKGKNSGIRGTGILTTTTIIGKRFIDNDDGTVLDGDTGLMWVKNANVAGNPMNWEEAMKFIDKLNVSNFGHSDWRLPSIQELSALVDSPDGPLLPADHPFINVQPVYWSLSPSPDYIKSMNTVWSMDISICSSGLTDRAQKLFVWPVRCKSLKIAK